MRTLIILWFLCLRLIAADSITTFEDGVSGNLITTTNLNNSTFANLSGGYWLNSRGSNTFASMTITNSNKSFSRVFAINGTNYDGSGTRAMVHGDIGDSNTWAEVATYHLPSMPNFGYVISFGVFLYFDMTNTTDTLISYDFMWNSQAAFQIGVRQGIISFDSEGTPTNFGDYHSLTNRHWYWACCLLDYGNGVMKYQYFDPSNGYSSMGESIATITGGNPTNQAFNTHDLGFGDPYSTHLAGGSGYFMWDNLVIDWTAATYPFLPASLSMTNTFGNAILGNVRNN